MKHLIINVNREGQSIADALCDELQESIVIPFKEAKDKLSEAENIVFIGALGICVRMIAPVVRNKYSDPAVICVDTLGKYVIPVLSGHVGGANDLAKRIAARLGAIPVITTQSDNAGLWALDTLASKYGWTCDATKSEMNKAIFSFVNGEKTALILDIRDKGCMELERSLPPHVKVIKELSEAEGCQLVIAVSPYIYDKETLSDSEIQILNYRPKVLSMGVGCRKNCSPDGVEDFIKEVLVRNNISPLSVKTVASIELKKDEPLLKELAKDFSATNIEIYSASDLADIKVPNPSEKVREVTGVWGVAESCAIAASDGGPLLLEKQKGKLRDDSDFTFAVGIGKEYVRGGHIEIVGAGPGDPELVSVRGKKFLETADLILYAGSLVPRELTFYAKPGCVVRSSASMNLEEQFDLMKEFYDRGLLVVRLHTGDPSIYGAIQEQMAFFDRYNMSYHITPGISSFQAAAAALRSQFTIPEKVQSIILTRGEGRTPMPEREQLHKLAKSRSTMCIYLSAAIVEDVQRELMMEYPPETPVAACYKLTWKDERIYRGQLKDLAKIVRDNNLTLTTLLVVGDAIDNRQGLSRLYDDSFKHLFRK